MRAYCSLALEFSVDFDWVFFLCFFFLIKNIYFNYLMNIFIIIYWGVLFSFLGFGGFLVCLGLFF